MVHDVEVKGLDADGEGDLLFLLKLLLGLGHLAPGILNVAHLRTIKDQLSVVSKSYFRVIYGMKGIEQCLLKF